MGLYDFLIGAPFVCAMIITMMVVFCPEGHQDDKGFHYGKKVKKD